MAHPIKCQCGYIQGTVAALEQATRIRCYCKDCQAFAYFLGDAGTILDSNGGTDIVQTSPSNITFFQGTDRLACVRLTEKGMVRWYANCCRTPIGNTLPSQNFSFVGIVHNCLESSERQLNDFVGATGAQINTESAEGDPKPKSFGILPIIGRNILRMIKDRVNGNYKKNPFFVSETDEPISKPQILEEENYNAL